MNWTGVVELNLKRVGRESLAAAGLAFPSVKRLEIEIHSYQWGFNPAAAAANFITIFTV